MNLKFTTKILSLAFLTLALASQSAVGGTVLVDEDFEGYADTAAMQVNWGASGLGVLDTGFGNGGQSAMHPGGTVNSWIGSAISVTPTASAPIVLTADIYDDGNSANERVTVGLRNGASPLFEMGHYNDTAEHYHVRVLSMYGGENWAPLEPGLLGGNAPPAGWNRYQAVFRADKLVVKLDQGADGTIDGRFVSNGVPSINPFVDLRFGGPSNLSSADGGVWYDNIRLEIVPEPASIALLSLAFVGTCAVRRRRQM